MSVHMQRDGMNLVSYEYVACQSDNAGVLVLSEFAGGTALWGCAVGRHRCVLGGWVCSVVFSEQQLGVH